MQCTGTCLVSSYFRLRHGKFEDSFDDFLQRFTKLLDDYHLVVSASLYCSYICILLGRLCQGDPFQSVLQIIMYLFCQFLSCAYVSLDRCFGLSGSSH